jgi:hypothetical protein
VIDYLTYEKKIPVAIYLLFEPGMIGTKAMRSIEHDTVSDLYPISARRGFTYNLRQLQHRQRRL